MCLPDLLCGLGFLVTGAFCLKLHCSDGSTNKKKVYPYIHTEEDDKRPRKATDYELQMYYAHMNAYGNKN